jgi:hypothetical protein
MARHHVLAASEIPYYGYRDLKYVWNTPALANSGIAAVWCMALFFLFGSRIRTRPDCTTRADSKPCQSFNANQFGRLHARAVGQL